MAKAKLSAKSSSTTTAKPPEKPPEAPKPEKKSKIIDPSDLREKPRKSSDVANSIKESRKVLEKTIAADQKYFESPEGFVMVGEKSKYNLWCGQANGGKGMLILPKR